MRIKVLISDFMDLFFAICLAVFLALPIQFCEGENVRSNAFKDSRAALSELRESGDPSLEEKTKLRDVVYYVRSPGSFSDFRYIRYNLLYTVMSVNMVLVLCSIRSKMDGIG